MVNFPNVILSYSIIIMSKRKFKINNNSFKIINLKNLKNIKSNFLSWKLFAEKGNVEVVWLSLNKKKDQSGRPFILIK